MKMYGIFKSEGGYRVCLNTYLGGPVISSCPWFETKEQANDFAFDTEFDNKTKGYGVFYADGSWICAMEEEFYSANSEKEGKNIVTKAIQKMGYELNYILSRRKDLR